MGTDIFARIGDIKGESLDAQHRDEIDIVSFSWGVTHTGAAPGGGGGGAGRATVQALSLVHNIDRATPALLAVCATGRRIRDATISHRRTGGGPAQDFLVIKLTDVAVTGVTHSGDTENPYFETITLTFKKVNFEYRPTRPDGSLGDPATFTFDVAAG